MIKINLIAVGKVKEKYFADGIEEYKKRLKKYCDFSIAEIAEENSVRFFTASKLRYFQTIEDLAAQNIQAVSAIAWGALGRCPEGYSVLIWYGIHTFELLERMMGVGAKSVQTLPHQKGFDCQILYHDGRSALVKMLFASGSYGCWVTDGRQQGTALAVSGTPVNMLNHFAAMCRGAEPPVSVAESLEIMAMLEAAERSFHSGKAELLEL